MEILILLGLIILNGVFAMSEMAIVAAKKVLLQEHANNGNTSAEKALDLAANPDRFLSTVQVGITLIGIVAGAFGGSALAEDIADFVRVELPFLAAQADQIGFGLIVIFITYLSLVIGELVPKRIALNHPERVAIAIAPTMLTLSRIATPLVWLLSKSTDVVARVLGIRETDSSVTDMEIIALVGEGVDAGTFTPSEQFMVREVLELDDISIREMMTPRVDLIWLDVQESTQESLAKIMQELRPVYPLCDGSIDNIIGVIHSEDILKKLLEQKPVELQSLAHNAVFVPETVIVANVLKRFRQPSIKVVFVIDEYGGIEGLVSKNDIIGEILGYFDVGDVHPVRRRDGSWLFDGYIPVGDIQHYLPDFEVPVEETTKYSTLAGFILTQMGDIPEVGDKIVWQSYSVEVMDMDGRRIDKVLISPVNEQPAEDNAANQDHGMPF